MSIRCELQHLFNTLSSTLQFKRQRLSTHELSVNCFQHLKLHNLAWVTNGGSIEIELLQREEAAPEKVLVHCVHEVLQTSRRYHASYSLGRGGGEKANARI